MIRIKDLFLSNERKRLFKNVLNLFFFQGTNYILPLVTIPYIVRIIGPEKFGILSFAQVLNQYFVIITDYGFNITGTQRISQVQEDIKERANVFSGILAVRILLLILTFCMLIVIIFLFSSLQQNIRIYLAYFLMIPGSILLSNWFFLGMEKMHFLNYPNVISKIGYTIFIFIFLKQENQYYLVAVFYGIFFVVGGMISFYLAFSHFKLKWSIPSAETIIFYFKDGWHIFISNLSISLYRQSNIFFLGLVAPKEIVGYYSAGEKIVKALQSVFTPVTQAFYPYVSRKTKSSPLSGIRSTKFLLKWMGGATTLIAIALIIFAKPLTLLFLGDKFTPSIAVLRISSFVVSLGLLNYIIGIVFMTNFGLKKEFSKGVIITGIMNTIVCLSLSYLFQEIGTAVAFLFSEFFLMGLLIFYIYINRSKWSSDFAA